MILYLLYRHSDNYRFVCLFHIRSLSPGSCCFSPRAWSGSGPDLIWAVWQPSLIMNFIFAIFFASAVAAPVFWAVVLGAIPLVRWEDICKPFLRSWSLGFAGHAESASSWPPATWRMAQSHLLQPWVIYQIITCWRSGWSSACPQYFCGLLLAAARNSIVQRPHPPSPSLRDPAVW